MWASGTRRQAPRGYRNAETLPDTAVCARREALLVHSQEHDRPAGHVGTEHGRRAELLG